MSWYSLNGLETIDPTSMYMIQMAADDTLSISGHPINTADNPIPLSTGWNWIGYLPPFKKSIRNALAGIEPNADFIKNQISFAVYYGETAGWYSSNGLLDMMPGIGYMIRMRNADELTFGADNAPTAHKNSQLEIVVPGWALDRHKYEHSMAITGVVIDGDRERRDTNLVVGAFAGDECRGIATLVPFPYKNRSEFGLLVYGEENDEIHFSLYDRRSGFVIRSTNTISFETNGIIGRGDAPYAIQISSVAETGLPSHYHLYQNYPNPFNSRTTIAYDVPVDSHIRLEIFDIRGQLVRTVERGSRTAGHYSVHWDGDNELGIPVVSGLYLCKLTGGAFTQTRKLILSK